MPGTSDAATGHLAVLGLGLGIGAAAGAQVLTCCVPSQPPSRGQCSKQQQQRQQQQRQLAVLQPSVAGSTLRRRVKLSAADPSTTPINDEVVENVLAALAPAVVEPGSLRLDARRSYAMATFTCGADDETSMAALDRALVATMVGGGLDVDYGWGTGSVDVDGRTADGEQQQQQQQQQAYTKRWFVTLADDHQGNSVYFNERAARAHNFGTLFSKGAGRLVSLPQCLSIDGETGSRSWLLLRFVICLVGVTILQFTWDDYFNDKYMCAHVELTICIYPLCLPPFLIPTFRTVP